MQPVFCNRFDCDAIGEFMCMRAHTFDLTHERLQTVGLMPAQMPCAGQFGTLTDPDAIRAAPRNGAAFDRSGSTVIS